MKTERRRIAILTKSNKKMHNGGFGSCVAGVTEDGEWIRLVSSEDGDSIPQNEAKAIPLKGIIEAEIRCAPLSHQVENAVLLRYSVIQDSILPFLQSIRQIDENGIFGSLTNKLSYFKDNQNGGTLRLIRVNNLKTYRRPGEKCKAEFTYSGNNYIDFAMTDPHYYAANGATRQIGDAVVVISLPENPPYFKFVAAIYPSR